MTDGWFAVKWKLLQNKWRPTYQRASSYIKSKPEVAMATQTKSKLMTLRDVFKQFMLKWHNFGHAPCLRKNKPSVLMEPPRCCCSFSSLGRWGERSMWGEGGAWYSCIISSPVNIPQSIAGELDVVLPLQPDNTLNSTHLSIIYPSVRPSAAPRGLHFTAPCTVGVAGSLGGTATPPQVVPSKLITWGIGTEGACNGSEGTGEGSSRIRG